ncbi:MAG TPA: (d)CMP kinase [Alphaproteobacteria bacterium]|nr:(d)CMP kinase [Alphaproteobacteria bacterium]
MPHPPLIAIDGPAASGKGTIAKKLAKHFDFAHLDTGLLYRAVGVMVLMEDKDPADAKAAEEAAKSFSHKNLERLKSEPLLRTDKASQAASKVAAVPGVRAALLKFQRDFAGKPPNGKKGAVLDGRDIGTIIAPEAPVKLYITASLDARAERRFKELQARGEHVTYAAVLADMKERDGRDEKRATAPSKPAKDAVIIDTSNMTADETYAEALNIAEDRLKKPG